LSLVKVLAQANEKIQAFSDNKKLFYAEACNKKEAGYVDEQHRLHYVYARYNLSLTKKKAKQLVYSLDVINGLLTKMYKKTLIIEQAGEFIEFLDLYQNENEMAFYCLLRCVYRLDEEIAKQKVAKNFFVDSTGNTYQIINGNIYINGDNNQNIGINNNQE